MAPIPGSGGGAIIKSTSDPPPCAAVYVWLAQSAHPRLKVSPVNPRPPIALLLFFVGLASAGCDRVEPIGHYKTPKEDVIRRLTADGEKESTPQEPTDRIVAAIIPRGQRAWIFRLTGPVAAVGKQLDSFKQLVQSTRFETEEAPQWTLPEGWKQQPASGLRFATIEIPPDGAPPLDLSVSVLPGAENDFDSYVLANLNRWRGQLGLSPLPPLRLQDAIEELKGEGLTATLVDISGKKSDDGMSRGPMAPGARPPGGPMSPRATPEAPRASEKSPVATPVEPPAPAAPSTGPALPPASGPAAPSAPAAPTGPATAEPDSSPNSK